MAKKSKLAIASLALSVAGMLITTTLLLAYSEYYFIGFLFSFIAIILAGIALIEIKHNPEILGKRIGTAGLILGILPFAVFILIILAAIIGLGRTVVN